MSDPTLRHDGASHSGERPLTENEKDTVKTAGPPATAAAGALAGAAAGISTLVFGPLGLVVGAVVGATAGAAVGAASSQAAAGDYYSAEYDDYYRRLWEDSPRRAADRTFDSARAGYQFGHVAAQHPEFAGRDFHTVEPELRSRWSDDLRTHAIEHEAKLLKIWLAGGVVYSRFAFCQYSRHKNVCRPRYRGFIQQHISTLKFRRF